MTRPVAVTDRTGLGQVLRTLKLSGMLATLDARLAQAAAGDLGHLDFLQVLCEDEISKMGIAPGQYGCAARGSNPEPAD